MAEPYTKERGDADKVARDVLSRTPLSSYIMGVRDLAAMPHVSLPLGDVYRDCADHIERLEAQIVSLREERAKAERGAVAECLRIIREQRDSFLSPEYATGGAISSIMERFACNECVCAIEDHFAIGTHEQQELLAARSTLSSTGEG